MIIILFTTCKLTDLFIIFSILHMSNQPTTQSVTQTVPGSTGVMQSVSYVQPNSGTTYANYGAVYYPTPQAPSQPTPLQ